MPTSPAIGADLVLPLRGSLQQLDLTVIKLVRDALAQIAASPASTNLVIAQLRSQVAQRVGLLNQVLVRQIVSIVTSAGTAGQAAAMADLAVLLRGTTVAPSTFAGLGRLISLGTSALQQVTSAMPMQAASTLRTVVLDASAQMTVGSLGRDQAYQHALNRAVAAGITSIRTQSGRRYRTSTYTEMAVRSTAAEAAVAGHIDVLAGAGVDLVRISDAPRECPLCSRWEGKVLRTSAGPTGRIQVQSLTGPGLVDVVVDGTLSEAKSLGLFHHNCRHAASAFLPGATRRGVPQLADRPGGYEAQQEQRRIERHIRGWKEREAAAMTPSAASLAATKISTYQAEMRDHLRRNPDLKRQSQREQVR